MSHDYEATSLSQMPFSLKPRLFDPRRPFSWKWNNIHFIKQLEFLIFGTYIETTDIKNFFQIILQHFKHNSTRFWTLWPNFENNFTDRSLPYTNKTIMDKKGIFRIYFKYFGGREGGVIIGLRGWQDSLFFARKENEWCEPAISTMNPHLILLHKEGFQIWAGSNTNALINKVGRATSVKFKFSKKVVNHRKWIAGGQTKYSGRSCEKS